MQVQRLYGIGNYNTSFAAKAILNVGYNLDKEDCDDIKRIIGGIGSENDTITIDISRAEQKEDSWSEMGHRYHVTRTSQNICVQSIIDGEEIKGDLSYRTNRDVVPSEVAARNIKEYLRGLKRELNMFDTNVVGQKFIDDNTIQFYNIKGDIVSEVTLLANESVKIKKTLTDKREVTIEDSPEQTIIKQRKRSDNKDVDITVYKGNLEGQMLITVDGHKIKIGRGNKVIEADPEFKRVISRSRNELEERAYKDYSGGIDVRRYIYDNKIIITRAKSLFKMGDRAWLDCDFFASEWPPTFQYYIVNQDTNR